MSSGGEKKSEKAINTYTLSINYPNRGRKPGPTRIWLIMDADDPLPSKPGSHNNYPDAEDNHGTAGLNIIYCDGHAAWLPMKNLFNDWNISFDDNRNSP